MCDKPYFGPLIVVCSCGFKLGIHKHDIPEIAAGVWGFINCPECKKKLNEKIKELDGEQSDPYRVADALPGLFKDAPSIWPEERKRDE